LCKAARLCVCEAQTGTSDAINTCQDCGHTACNRCCGRPEHNYGTKKTTYAQRLAPGRG
jgi:hypothetical protein